MIQQTDTQVTGQVTEMTRKQWPSGDDYYRFDIVEADGQRHWYSWANAAEAEAKLRVGSQYQFRYTLKANPHNEANPYRNITRLLKEFASSTADPPAPRAVGGTGPVSSRHEPQQYLLPQHPDVRRSIEGQSLFKALTEIRIAFPSTAEFISAVADVVNALPLARRGLSGSLAAPESTAAATETAEAEDTAGMPKFPEGVDPEVVIDTAHFGANCRDAGLGLQDVQRLLGNQDDNPLDAWQEQHRGTITQAWNHLVEAVEAESAGPPRRNQAEDVIRI